VEPGPTLVLIGVNVESARCSRWRLRRQGRLA
jgi:hypothetical protein